MSARRGSNAQAVVAALESLAGHEVAGGCDSCAAFQMLSRLEGGVWKLATYHDAGCTELARHRARRPA